MRKITLLSYFIFHGLLLGYELPVVHIESLKVEDPPLNSFSTINEISKDKLDTFSTRSLQDLSSVIPNTNISGIGNRMDKTISLRGVSNYVSFESSVGMYIDDTPVPFSYGFGMVDMKNVSHIEFIKGSQATSFGKNAQSALINIQTNAPQKESIVKGLVGFSSYGTSEFYGFASTPKEDHEVSASFSITHDKSDGFSKNILDGKMLGNTEFTSFSTKLLYSPLSNFSTALNYTKSQSDDGGSAFKIDTKENPYSIDNEMSGDFVKMDMDFISFVMKYSYGDTLVTSATSITNLCIKRDDYVGILGGLQLGFDIELKEFSQEFKYKKRFNNSELLLGAYYSDMVKFDYKEIQTLLTLYPFPISSINNLNNPNSTMALFSNYKYYIDENFTLLTGLRYQATKRLFDRNLSNFGYPYSTHVDASSKWYALLPMISLSYDTSKGSTLYATYTKNYSPGGYNYRSEESLLGFRAEKIDSFEIGYKKRVAQTLFSSALFYNNIRDHVVNQFNDTLSSYAVNVDGYDYGLEVDAEYQSDRILLYATLGTTQTKIEASNDGLYDGKEFIDVADVTASLGAKFAMGGGMYAKSDIRYMGERYYDVQNSAKLNGYAIADVAFGYEKKGFKAELYSENVCDKKASDFMISTYSNNYYHFVKPMVLGFRIENRF